MIEMKCPACGAEGRVPNDKINTRLVCKKCLKVFHLSPSGRAVPGEPGPGPAATATPKEASHDPTQDVDQWFERLGKRLTSPASLGIVLTLILAGGYFAFGPSRKSEPLQDRVSRVARAAVQGDLQTIRSLAATGTGEDAVKWYDAIRTRCDDMRQRVGSRTLKVDVTVSKQESDLGPTEVVAQVASEDQIERQGAALPDALSTVHSASTQSLDLPMSWRNEGLSGWRLDGKRTLELADSVPDPRR